MQYVEAVVSEAAPARRKSNNKQVDVGSFLREHVLGILSSLNDILNDGQGKKSASHKATVVRSVGALVEVVGSTISLVTPQVRLQHPESCVMETFKLNSFFFTSDHGHTEQHSASP